MHKKVLVLLFSLLPCIALANNFIVGQPVKSLSITDKGQLLLSSNDEISYQSWNSSELIGKVRIIQYIAGRTSAKKENDVIIKAVKSAHFPTEHFQPVTIVNADDELFGTGLFVQGKIEKNKRKYPWAQFIIDSQGSGRSLWQLPSGTSTIIVTDEKGRVQWQKDGGLTNQEVSSVMKLLHTLIEQSKNGQQH